MNRALLSIVLMAVLAHSAEARIAKNTLGRRDFNRLYRAAIDIAMTCYGDPGKAIGIVGDTDGSILKALRSNHFIPVALVNGTSEDLERVNNSIAYKLQVFIIAVHSPMHLVDMILNLNNYIWWNDRANFLIVDKRPEMSKQCSSTAMFMFATTQFAMLNAQFICYDLAEDEDAIIIYNSHPFMLRAPKVWTFLRRYTIRTRLTTTTGYLFVRIYQEGGSTCRFINFSKTTNACGFPLHFLTNKRSSAFRRSPTALTEQDQSQLLTVRIITTSWLEERLWFIDSIVNALNVSKVIVKEHPAYLPGIYLDFLFFSDYSKYMARRFDRVILRRNQQPIFAVTQHTGHMTQLDKILSVVDGNTHIGICLVYMITFMFFKFFLRQTVASALLDLVRLTSNTGLARLPRNVAPTLYLTSLFIFVVTMQAIFTGNLATLLTTTIAYKNVQVKEDIPKLGYTLYIEKDGLTRLFGDPVLDGCIVEIPYTENCIDYVLRDPLAACAFESTHAVASAYKYNLHISRAPIVNEYMYHITSNVNMFRPRIQELFVKYFEAGLSYSDPRLERLRLQFIDDDDVNKNTDRRVMSLIDLRFAFVILGIGLLCSFVCLIGEIVICRVRLKYAERRDRIRVRTAWGVTAKRLSWFPSLNCRFNLRRLFARRRN